MVTRRSFFAYAGGTALTLYAYNRFGIKEALAAIPGGSLDPNAVPKYVTPMLIPPQMPRAGILFERDQRVDYYEIAVRQFQQQILPAGFGKTTVWGYGPNEALSPLAPIIFNAPSLTIEANAGVPVRIKWINQLTDGPNGTGNFLPHLLPIDPTLHWANPPGGKKGRDTRPTFASTPGRYTGPVPMVPHVHGAIGVGDESDGYAEAWWLPDVKIPAGYADVGTWYEFFAKKAKDKFGVNWGPGFAIFQYPNDQRAATIWYHDHTLGMTGKNVYAGPAGFYIVRGGPAGDGAVRDSRTGARAILPGPAPSEIDQVIKGRKFYEIGLAIQDRSFNANGSLFYPDSRVFFDGYTGPYIPTTDVAPIHNPEFFGNCMMVNGATWPVLQVEARRYRLRLLNGCDSRTLVLKFDDPRVQVWQIGNETGFLQAVVNTNATPPDQSVADGGKAVLLMGNAERADLIVDFTNVPAGTPVILRNVGPDAPFGGFPIDPLDAADPDTTGQVMRFDVVAATSVDRSTPPQFLRLPAIAALPAEVRTRKLSLVELAFVAPAPLGEIPVETRLGTVDSAGNYNAKKWMDAVTENPGVGDTEIWEFYNTTIDAHPMHIHEVGFEVLNRQAIIVNQTNAELGTGTVTPTGATRDPEPWERGRKDTVLCLPGEVTRVKATFASPGQFVWHCHIVEHEDNEMMRPYRIGPVQPGQPG